MVMVCSSTLDIFCVFVFVINHQYPHWCSMKDNTTPLYVFHSMTCWSNSNCAQMGCVSPWPWPKLGEHKLWPPVWKAACHVQASELNLKKINIKILLQNLHQHWQITKPSNSEIQVYKKLLSKSLQSLLLICPPQPPQPHTHTLISWCGYGKH